MKLMARISVAVVVLLVAGAVQAQELRKVRMGSGDKAVSPVMINLLIPEYLGYFKQEGLSGEVVPAGSSAAVTAGTETGRIEFGVVTAGLAIPRVAKGEKIGTTNFFEYTYPFKYGVATAPGSAIKKLADLKGKKLGVSSFGNAEYTVGQALLKLAGLDPEKDVSWLAVGEGTTSGIALQRHDIDALMYYDTGFGQIESAGIALDYLPLPPNLPMVAGSYLSATPDFIREHRAVAVGTARAVLKGEIFVRENPEAASYIFVQMFPEAAPKGMALRDQVKAVMLPVMKRAKLYAPFNSAVTKWGYMTPSEWRDQIAFYGFEKQIPDTSVFYTNALIDEINDFDWNKVKADAKNFKLPY